MPKPEPGQVWKLPVGPQLPSVETLPIVWAATPEMMKATAVNVLRMYMMSPKVNMKVEVVVILLGLRRLATHIICV